MFQKEPVSYTSNVDLALFMEDRQSKTSFYASLLPDDRRCDVPGFVPAGGV